MQENFRLAPAELSEDEQGGGKSRVGARAGTHPIDWAGIIGSGP